jgi:hypothetical protein
LTAWVGVSCFLCASVFHDSIDDHISNKSLLLAACAASYFIASTPIHWHLQLNPTPSFGGHCRTLCTCHPAAPFTNRPTLHHAPQNHSNTCTSQHLACHCVAFHWHCPGHSTHTHTQQLDSGAGEFCLYTFIVFSPLRHVKLVGF